VSKKLEIKSMSKENTAPMEDVQSSQDTRQIPINKVGIKDIRHPVRVSDRTVANNILLPTLICM